MVALSRLVALVRRPATPAPAPSPLVALRLLRKHVEAHGAVLNAGEVVGLSPVQAAALIREGSAVPCGPTATSTVRPRPTDETTYRLAASPASEEDTWSAPSDDGGMIVLQWPPRAVMNDRTPRR